MGAPYIYDISRLRVKGNVYFSRHSEITPTRNLSKNRKTFDHYINILYFKMLSLFLRDLDLTVPGVSKSRQQLKSVN